MLSSDSTLSGMAVPFVVIAPSWNGFEADAKDLLRVPGGKGDIIHFPMLLYSLSDVKFRLFIRRFPNFKL